MSQAGKTPLSYPRKPISFRVLAFKLSLHKLGEGVDGLSCNFLDQRMDERQINLVKDHLMGKFCLSVKEVL